MDLSVFAIIGLPVVVSLLAVRWVYFKILKIAKEKNLVDNPDARKLQKVPVPVVGGLAVFFGLLFGLLCGITMMNLFAGDIGMFSGIVSVNRLLPIVLGMSIMLYVGCMDDIMGLSPKARFLIEILVILGLIYSSGISVDSLHGLWGIDEIPSVVAVPLTIFAGVGIINAINMVDGVNGLSSGLCITCSMLFGLQFFCIGDYVNAVLAFSIASSLFLFFIHNVFGNQSRMFIGDAGTMVMGVLMTWFVMCSMHDAGRGMILDYAYCPTAMVVAILSVPVADTLRVMTMRVFHGKSPFSPDKTHLHHAFVGIGVSHSITALSEILIDVIVVAIWYLSVRLGAPLHCQLYTVVLVAAILVWGTYAFLVHEQNSNSRIARWLRGFSPKTHLGSTEWWQRLTYRLDSPEFDEHERKNLRERLERKFVNR
ncbi:MAG: undecaprenyl/decaprenyl-phosphate alpha-N-acetylglucosaminyl 1-phosphate transferase [Bacteroidaceae bacterium]|nr:undecaprenyl/decaprenyl-phosphate alpha-N-acetylglucosaminyl 1-phosphate transferase [Bacteroidaceae bacterium]